MAGVPRRCRGAPLPRWLALARALTGEGDHAAAERELRETWWSAELSAGLEAEVLDTFRDVLTPDDLEYE